MLLVIKTIEEPSYDYQVYFSGYLIRGGQVSEVTRDLTRDSGIGSDGTSCGCY